jgi:hypothetical protein
MVSRVRKRSARICRDWKRFCGFPVEAESEPPFKDMYSLGGRKWSHRADAVDVPTLLFGFWPKILFAEAKSTCATQALMFFKEFCVQSISQSVCVL